MGHFHSKPKKFLSFSTPDGRLSLNFIAADVLSAQAYPDDEVKDRVHWVVHIRDTQCNTTVVSRFYVTRKHSRRFQKKVDALK